MTSDQLKTAIAHHCGLTVGMIRATDTQAVVEVPGVGVFVRAGTNEVEALDRLMIAVRAGVKPGGGRVRRCER